MKTRYFALVAGIVFLVIGLLGFVPNLLALPASAPELAVKTGYGYLFGLFPVNVLHNIVRLVVGILGIVAYRKFVHARLFARGMAIFYGIVTVLGLIPATATLFGLIPIFGHNIWLHALAAVISAYFGYMIWERELQTA
ncbi:MAG: DUF4383 domain-containing protein [Hydrococcus sp. C42_A2020_068]|uniref:DUF4383 domain-containing protein n=1 Tax=Pleurocapsa sp. PCC 7327 TaxID=118163 RepID=UPI00029FE47D|nr:DUF4383 domain-containing protein [Pleurocapsa sp. PCC 7327]AFY79509.1 hypothetical protein Ple7327_4401 [Pleurocapsa sp. PCC 7327]MBF2021083.1 DUF4383 domain-containing protein [Hydrococcus sp. C42_A2020_068]